MIDTRVGCVRMYKFPPVFLLIALASLLSVDSSPIPLEFRGFFGKNGDRDGSLRAENQPRQHAKQVPHAQQAMVHAQVSKPVSAAKRIGTCRVSFRLKNEFTQPGDTLLALGNVPSFGNWDGGSGLVFSTTAATFPWWHAEAPVPPGTSLEFKFVMKKAAGNLLWENGPNRRMDVVAAPGMKMETSFGDMRANVEVEGEVAEPETSREIVESGGATTKELATAAGGELVENNKELTARLFFRVRCETKIGENVGVCGSEDSIGAWSPDKALPLKTTADEYPFWSGCADVAVSQVNKQVKYKYLIKHPQGQWWEDKIADRTVEREAGTSKGVLSNGLDTYVDDGTFNELQRVCTYVREREVTGEKPKLQVAAAIEDGKPFDVPEGYQLVTLDQVLQWTAQLEELESECQSWRDRIEAAESTIVVLTSEIEQGQAQKVAFVQSMDTAEEHLARLEETVDVVEEKKKQLRSPQKLRVP
mmetsp:Transcript_62117/g.146017  ORF Transcript_62117/g.146017 Transcript_62117/m.146017 type:complete len:475 (+) Transcript_62117:112-1536(+)